MATEIKYHTKEAAIAAISQDPFELRYCTPELQNNEKVVLSVVKKNSWFFEYVSDEFKSNKHFIMKAINKGVYPDYLIEHSTISIHTDLEVMTLALEVDEEGWVFKYAKGEIALNKELAAKALVKWESLYSSKDLRLWSEIHPTLQEFFTQDSWYEKAQVYLHQLEQEKQAELVSGGSTAEDEVVW